MERPQNGVNGNLPQPSFGYTYVNTQMQRNSGQNLYGYETNQQVVPNQYVHPGNYSMQHNVANPIRSMSPSMSQTPLFYSYPNVGIPYPYPYQQSYPVYNYPQEIQQPPSKPVSNPQTTRKLNPLIVVDPTSNTDVDLSRYQSTSEKVQSTNVLQILEPINEKKSMNKDDILEKDIIIKHDTIEKENVDKLDIKKEIKDSIDILKSEDNFKIDDHTTIKDVDNLKILKKEELDIEAGVKDLDKIRHIKIEEADVKQIIESEQINVIEDIKAEIPDIKNDNQPDDSNIPVETHEISMFFKSGHEEEIIACSSEEETIPIELSPTALNYHLPINKKESDATTLKRKQIYDREYLIKFKDIGKSRQWPVNMPLQSEFSEDIISTTPRYISCQLPESSSSQMNVDKATNKKQLPNRQYSSGYKKYRPNPVERKQINLDISETQVFVRSKSGYLPPQFRDKQSKVDPYVELKRNIKSNLNKITPQNFQDCLAEIEKLNIYDKEEMSCLINEIFIKAVKEEAYSVTYAQFCNKLAFMYMENQSFKGQLLKKCQDMFETPLQAQLCTVKSDWELKISNETDLKMKALYESDLEEQVKKAKDKYFGNIRFIGELFLHSLLAAKVILNCIVELLNGSDDSDAMLALCKLLETCGKQIDTKHKDQMNKFIIKINELSQSKDLEKRIRFKLRDIIDMRERDWTSRHVQQEKKINPKTLQELKDEAAAEASAASTKFAAMTKKRNVPSNNSRRSMPPVNHRQLSIKKLTCNSHTVDEKTVLGPVGGNWSFWSGSKPKSNETDGWTPVGSQKPKTTASRYTSNSRSREQSPQVIFQNKYRNLESSAEASGADSRSSTPPLTLPITKPYRVRTIEAEIVISDEDRADIIFNELLSTGHFNVSEWVQLRQVKPVIEKWIDDMMEKDVNSRKSIGDSFTSLLIDKKLTSEQIVEGTQVFVSSIDDLICDIPKLWEFFAQFLERFIHDKNSNISFFENVFKSILPNMNVANCFSAALHEASSRLGHNIVGQVFHRSMNWNSIVPHNLDSFIKENGLEFTLYGGAPLSPVGGEPLNYIAEELDDMLSSNASNENIFDFLEKHIDKPTWKKSEFTKTITTSILKALKRMPESSIREFLKKKKEIIKRISNRKTDNEMEILISILHVAHELKRDTLTMIYDLLITEGIVSSGTAKSYLANEAVQSEHNFELTYSIISQLCFVKR